MKQAAPPYVDQCTNSPNKDFGRSEHGENGGNGGEWGGMGGNGEI